MLYFALMPTFTFKSFPHQRIQSVLHSFSRKNWENAASRDEAIQVNKTGDGSNLL
jgi:hypothetical protein